MTAAAASAAAPGRRSVFAIAPSRDEAVDALLLLALTAIGIVGFRPAYGGHGYLVAGVGGAMLGLVLSHVCHRAGLPVLAVSAVGVLAFLLLGGLVSQARPGGRVPTLATVHVVASAAIHGWQQLLTTAQPVGSAAHLLVLPYLAGLAAAVAGHALARRTSRILLPVLAPASVVAVSILFGADHASAAVLQGAAFAALALGWAALRQHRGTGEIVTVRRQRPWQRLAAATAVLGIAVAGATVLGPRLPGAHAHQRVVLHAVPPFNVNAYPSPLAAFRDYTKDAAPGLSLYARKLLTATGLPAGAVVRIAAMDSYNGLAWGVANATAGSSSFAGFQSIGSSLPGAGTGRTRTATITIESAYQQPWLPDLAGTSGLAFTGRAGRAVESTLRFNVATGTGIVPGGVPAGLRYTVTVAAAAEPTAAQLADAAPYGTPDGEVTIPAAIRAFANLHAVGAASPMARVLALAAYLKRTGRYSDGGGNQSYVLAGHTSGRLTTFLESSQIVGDDEQYAAAMALLANAVGVPARVALDGTVQPDGSVYGRDVHADVELDLAQYGWVTLPASQFTGTQQPQPQPQTTPPPPTPAKVVPPPVSNPAPVTDNEANSVSRAAPSTPSGGQFQLPAVVVALLKYVGLPLLALVLLTLALTGTKAMRRRRRQRRGPVAARVTGAWRELLDFGRDLGIVPDAHATRREHAAQAERRGLRHAAVVAVATDAAVFGPDDPDDAAASRVWALVDEARRDATASLTRLRRAWVAVNPASLWPARSLADGR